PGHPDEVHCLLGAEARPCLDIALERSRGGVPVELSPLEIEEIKPQLALAGFHPPLGIPDLRAAISPLGPPEGKGGFAGQIPDQPGALEWTGTLFHDGPFPGLRDPSC